MIELLDKDLTRVRHANATDHFGPLEKYPTRSISFAAGRHIIGTRFLSKSEARIAPSSIYLDTANSFARWFGKRNRERLAILPPSASRIQAASVSMNPPKQHSAQHRARVVSILSIARAKNDQAVHLSVCCGYRSVRSDSQANEPLQSLASNRVNVLPLNLRNVPRSAEKDASRIGKFV